MRNWKKLLNFELNVEVTWFFDSNKKLKGLIINKYIYLLSELFLERCHDVTLFKTETELEEWISGPIPYYLLFKSLKYFSQLSESEDKIKLCRLLSKCIVLPFGYTFF